MAAQLEREALDMLAGVRRKLRVYLGLQRVYEAVAGRPQRSDPRNCEHARAER